MRKFISKNPFNNALLSEIKFHSQDEVNTIIDRSYLAFQSYKNLQFKKKAEKLLKLSDLIEANVDKYAKLISMEMGKPITQAKAEVKKSAGYCRFYAENAEKYIKQERIKTEAKHSYVKYEPLGPLYVMGPFNFPFWLCFKPIIPQLALGNTIIFKPSESTGLMGIALEELFREAGYDQYEYQNIFSKPDQLESIISNNKIQGVSLTGSTQAGSIIGAMASKYLKRSVLELGGSDPFCVMREANIQQAVSLALKSRIANCGQVCFSAKRFIIHEAVYDKFKTQLVAALKNVRIGDPLSAETDMGPMARSDLLEKLRGQVNESVKQGGNVIYGQDELEGNLVNPIVIEIDNKNLLSKEEAFGPLFALMKASSNDKIIELANDNEFGLGAVIVSQQDGKELSKYIDKLECGMVAVNEIVKSDARLPSGGIKNSGYGRECGYWGLQNFVNVKTVWIQ